MKKQLTRNSDLFYQTSALRDNEYYEYKPAVKVLLYLPNLLPVLFGGIFAGAGFFVRYLAQNNVGTCRVNGRIVPCSEIAWFPWIFIIIGFYIIFAPIVKNILKYFESKTKSFRFFKDHFEYMEGFLNQEKESIQASKIKAISLEKTVLQRMHGLGSIYLDLEEEKLQIVRVSGRSKNNYFMMKDIENPDKVYQEIKDLYDL